MNIPKTVKIGFNDYKVNMSDKPIVQNDALCHGTIEFYTGKINILAENSLDMQKCTLIHEILHGIDNVVEAELTEDQIRLMGKGVYAFIKDNPSMFIDK